MTIRVVVCKDHKELSLGCAQYVVRTIRQHPELVIGLPTGQTPQGTYRELVGFYDQGRVDLSRITSFNIDEYLDLPLGHPASFAAYMEKSVWSHVHLDPTRRHIPSSAPDDPAEECRRYERKIREAGGLDLTILGLGVNGHIGFNEPGTDWALPTHVTTLTASTRLRQISFGGFNGACPKRAITMGVSTIRSSRTVLLLASGSEKAPALERSLRAAPSIDCPASALQTHENLLVVADYGALGTLLTRGSNAIPTVSGTTRLLTVAEMLRTPGTALPG